MTATEVVVHGHCAKRFEPVRDAFLQNFRDGLEIGAATSVVIDGEMVVDLWAGHADTARTRPWNEDTLVQVMSTTKGITAIVANRLIERGLIDVDAPVAKYWPEFAEAGKENITVLHLLTHQAGLPALETWHPTGTLQDWSKVTSLLAKQKPLWGSDPSFAYHAVTFGFLVGEVIRRVSGKTVGQLIREEISGPLGVDFELGFGEELDPRVAQLVHAAPAPPEVKDLVNLVTANPMGLIARALLVAVPSPETDYNTRRARAAEVPASNGHTNARALATIYGNLVAGETHGVRLLSQDALARAIEVRAGGTEQTLLGDMYFGLGFALRRPEDNVIGRRSFGHPGFGGSEGFGDPDRKLGFGYVMNQLGLASAEEFVKTTGRGGPPADPRATRILKALYALL